MLSKILCTPERKLFPPGKEDELGFMLCSYVAADPTQLPDGAKGAKFVAKGPLLPYSPASQVVLYGDGWETDKKGELTFRCIGYDEAVPDTPSAAHSFLQTLPYCESKEANRLINAVAGEDCQSVLAKLDADDGTLFTKALGKKGKAIFDAFALRRAKRDVFFYLLPFFTKSQNKTSVAQPAAEAAVFSESVDEVKRDPFTLVIHGVLPYRVCKSIAKENNVAIDSPRGIQAAIMDVLLQNEGSSSGRAYGEDEAVGNTYCPKAELLQKAASLVGLRCDNPLVENAFAELVEAGHCICVDGQYVYRKATHAAERGIAAEISRLMEYDVPTKDYRLDIDALENKKHMRIAPEQRRAVKTVLTSPVSLLIGGPGTGKTTIEQFIVEIFRAYHKDTPILLLAPTGKAARRMSEATGEPACTIHKGLGVSAGDEVLSPAGMLDAGLILVDEASMLDTQVAHALLKAIATGTQLVLVGDTNQLPSVGAGNVLFELIASCAVPIAALEKVHRQKDGSTIAVNCARIKRGATNLEYSDAFIFQEVESQEEAVQAVLRAYQDELDLGVSSEDICLLSPYRQNTLTGVNQLNPELQKLVGHSEVSIKYGTRTFYLGDKVMYLANAADGDVANGDVGYISGISDDGKSFEVDYRDGRKLTYRKGELRNFDLAYGISIHKSQGCEFRTCIIVLMDEHKTMLKRNLFYTAVSRAKQKVIIVGTRSAMETAILTEDVSKRRSRLSNILAETIAE